MERKENEYPNDGSNPGNGELDGAVARLDAGREGRGRGDTDHEETLGCGTAKIGGGVGEQSGDGGETEGWKEVNPFCYRCVVAFALSFLLSTIPVSAMAYLLGTKRKQTNIFFTFMYYLHFKSTLHSLSEHFI
mmetsp:Transcript_1210/g.1778  ORF Transcript_1210/g.1778 Transcript_1210/m.1778 type:complete len:133 (+) Transcript_1210:295-693(+)